MYRAVWVGLALWLVGGIAFGLAPSTTAALSPTSLASATSVPGKLLAFPGAEGFGAPAVGGRRGKAMMVTNLHDSGRGSLRECIEASGPRTCIFRTGGTIVLQSNLDIVNPFITIAGQTAPGGGITLKAASEAVGSPIHVRTHDVIIRFLRSRPGTYDLDHRALSIGDEQNPPYNVIVDHSSFSWSGDEVVIAWYSTQRITFSWNIFSESLPCSDHSVGLKGPNLGSTGGGDYSFHHNLVAYHTQRLPNISTSGGPVDVVNNLMYDPGGIGSRVLNNAEVNFVGNYVEAGPDTHLAYFVKDDGASGFYLSGNFVEGNGIIRRFLPWRSRGKVRAQPYAAPPVTTTDAATAYEQVLVRAGASAGLACDGTWVWSNRRDAVDMRIVDSVRNDRSSHDTPSVIRGYIQSPADVGGWPVLEAGTPCPDADLDGMPDVWEVAHGLNPAHDDSAADQDGDGYTNLEAYLDGIPFRR